MKRIFMNTMLAALCALLFPAAAVAASINEDGGEIRADKPMVCMAGVEDALQWWDESGEEGPAMFGEPPIAEVCAPIAPIDMEPGEGLALEQPQIVLASYEENPLARKHVDRNISLFTGRLRGHFALWLERSGSFLSMMKAILREEGLPEDIAYLPLIESGFNTSAYSRMRAAGPWQFIEGTARRYGLTVNWWVDERRDPVKSTHAAARYLRELHEMFGSWGLAMAAYNAGEGKIKRALSRTGSSDYWGLLPTRHIKRETKDYVPKFIAAHMIAKEPEKYGFIDVNYHDEFDYDEVLLTAPRSIETLARCAGTTQEYIKSLNPELRRWVTPPVQSYTLRIPKGSAERFLAELETAPAERIADVKEYRVRRGDTIGGIARKMGVPQAEIVRMNKLRGNGRIISIGQVLVIPVPEYQYSRIAVKDLPAVSLGSGLKGKVYTVRYGDTVAHIAAQTGVATGTLMALNNLDAKGTIHAGQKILIPRD